MTSGRICPRLPVKSMASKQIEVAIQHNGVRLKMIRQQDATWKIVGRKGREPYTELRNIVGEGDIKDDEVAIFVLSQTLKTIIGNNT
jgi:hypothetical protein